MDEKRRRNSTRQTSSRTRTTSHTQLKRSETNTDANMSRRKKSRKRKQFRYDNKKRLMLFGGLAAVLVLACIIGFATRSNGSEILVNGESVGIVNTRKVTEDDIIKSVTAMLSEQAGTNVQIMDEIKLKGVHVSKKTTPLTTETLLTKLRDSVAYNIEAYAIAVNGDVVVTLKNNDEAKKVLEYLNSKYTPEGVENAKISYTEDVQIVTQFVNSESIMTVEDAENKITIGETVSKTHTVASGQTLSYIASKYGMTMQQLYNLNSDLNPSSKIFVGQEIKVQANNPIITVKATVTKTEKQTTPKEVEYQYDSTKSSTYKKIVQKGTDGVSEVTKEEIYINGIFDSENIVSTKAVTEAVKEIVSIGTN